MILFMILTLLNFIIVVFVQSDSAFVNNVTDFYIPVIWEAETYPKPLSNDGYYKCNVKYKSRLCDPENILSEAARKNIIQELKILRNNTSNKNAKEYCDQQGVIGGVAVANRFVGGSSLTLKYHAYELLQKWDMDDVCEKAIIIVIAVKDRSFWISKDTNIPIHGSYFTQLFENQKDILRSGDYETALINVIQTLPSIINSNNETNKCEQISDIIIIIIIIILVLIIFTLAVLFCMYCDRSSRGCSSGGYSSGTSSYGENYGYSSGGSGGGGDWEITDLVIICCNLVLLNKE